MKECGDADVYVYSDVFVVVSDNLSGCIYSDAHGEAGADLGQTSGVVGSNVGPDETFEAVFHVSGEANIRECVDSGEYV